MKSQWEAGINQQKNANKNFTKRLKHEAFTYHQTKSGSLNSVKHFITKTKHKRKKNDVEVCGIVVEQHTCNVKEAGMWKSGGGCAWLTYAVSLDT